MKSKRASPRLSLSQISFVVHVCPPSKLTPSSIPASGKSTFETSTMLFGLVGLMAIASSDSFVCRWLMSTFVGAAAPTGIATSRTTQRAAQNAATDGPGRMLSPSLGCRQREATPPDPSGAAAADQVTWNLEPAAGISGPGEDDPPPPARLLQDESTVPVYG